MSVWQPRAVVAVSATLLALAASPPAGANELWRGPAGVGECHLLLVNELGGVSIAATPEGSEAVVHGASALRIEASAGDERQVLSVAWADGSPGGAPGDVELSVPPGCDVAVRTTDGEVRLEVGREAFPVAVDTVTGNITATVDPAADATVTLATSGEITTDFTIAIDFRYHEEPAKRGRVTVTGGATEIRLTSRRGTVSVLRPTREQSSPR